MAVSISWIYDVLLATLDLDSGPMYASMFVIMCMCLVVPLSWEKTQMQPEVVWTGWQVSTPHWTVTLTSEKREAILDDLNQILRVHKLPIKLLEKVTDKPFMVTSARHQLRPLWNAFYGAVGSPPTTNGSSCQNHWIMIALSQLSRTILHLRSGFGCLVLVTATLHHCNSLAKLNVL